MRPDGTSMLQSGAALVLDGIAGSAGYAIGHVVIVDTRRSGIVRRHIAPEAAAEELQRFDDVVKFSADELRVVLAAKQGTASRAETSILEAYVLMLEDETLRAAVEGKIASAAICAEWALDLAVAEMAAVLRQSGDPYRPNAATTSNSSKIACYAPWPASRARSYCPKMGRRACSSRMICHPPRPRG